MVLFGFFKKKIAGLRIGKPKRRSLPLISLASAESLTVPHVQVVELTVEIGCRQCQKRLAHVLSKMGATADSMVLDVLEKKVTVTCRGPVAKGSVMEVPAVLTCSNSAKHGRKMLLLPPCN